MEKKYSAGCGECLGKNTEMPCYSACKESFRKLKEDREKAMDKVILDSLGMSNVTR